MSGRIVLERDGDVLLVIIDNPPVNAGSTAVRQGLLDAVAALEADPALQAAVLIGAGKTFIAGSDIREFGQPLQEPQLPAVIAAIEACPKPVVAALHGAALGGGYELALGCDARVAAPGTVVGLPEVTLGMIPGAGGSVRLPRLVGVPKAIELICAGTRVEASKARALGMVDEVVEGELRSYSISYARGLAGVKRRLRELSVPKAQPAEVDAAAAAALKAGKRRPQVHEAIAAVKRAAELPVDQALAQERAVFQELRVGREAFALRHQFFAERNAAKVPGLEGVSPRAVETVGIIGAGTMGVGILACFLDAGYPVVLIEQDQAGLERGLERLKALYERNVASGRLSAEAAAERQARVTPATDYQALSQVDLVVEAVFEDLEVKTTLFRALDAVLKPGAVLASNTSYLDLDRIAAATARPADVCGLHFFSPANIMKLVEVVRGKDTAPEVLATALAVAKRLRKMPVVAANAFGFIGNRIYAAYRRQAEFLLEEGAYPEDVDAAMEAFGMAMGPFAVGDLSGLDIAWRMRQSQTRDPQARYVEIPDRLCEQGRLGQKTGAGYYRYPEGARRGQPDPEVRALIEACSAAKGITRRPFSAQEIQRRLLLTMVNEAALLLSEGVALRASDIDLVLVNGYGFPKWEGGPVFWAGHQERDALERELDALAQVSGHGFRRGELGVLYP